ncbi:steroid transmembrane transporter SLC22A24-like [Ochotona princeps]|uniref:steroid transmembrane transporter SLC22A24-like n=1 Tax=Ochotona princeps TaxID=9978 RepID=UPI002714F62C|nr:steroid transmembrane transporter SLC22A24-like [Ochotona princeps]
MAFDELLDQAGTLGRFQILQIAFFSVANMIAFPHVLLENFIAATPEHRCWVPLLDNRTVSHNDTGILSQDDLLRVSIPLDSNLKPEKCHRFIHPQWQLLHLNATLSNISESDTEPCVDGWVYDQSSFLSTIVTEWDLVCDYQSQKSVVQTLFMSGSLLGSLILGRLSDRYGRKLIYTWCLLLTAIVETGTAFAPNFIIFCILRFLAGTSVMTILLNSTNLTSEWTVPRSQHIGVTLMLCACNLGQMLLGGIAFAIRDWYTLQLVVSLPLFVCSLLSRWLVESARWLITINQQEEGLKALRRVAYINGKKSAGEILTTEVIWEGEMVIGLITKTSLVLSLSIVEVFEIHRSGEAGQIQDNTINISDAACNETAHENPLPGPCEVKCMGMGATVPIMGSFLNLQEVGDSIFLLQVIFGAVPLIARLSVIFIMKRLDRRPSQSLLFFLVGLCMLIGTFLPKEMQTPCVALATLGIAAGTSAATFLPIYSSELIPTICRSTFGGINHLFSGIGAVLAPLMMTLVVYSPHLPWIMYGVFPILAGLIVFCLPETRNQPFPETIQDVENS